MKNCSNLASNFFYKKTSVRQTLPIRSRHFFYILLILSAILLHQTGYGQKVGYGPKLGAGASFFRGDFPISGMRLPKFGYSFGGYLSIKGKKNKKWQFEMNLLYTKRGNNSNFTNTINLKENDPYPAFKNEFTYNIGYLEIPLLFKYMLNKGGMVRPYLIFGPVYSGLINATFTNNTLGNKKELDAKDYLNRDDFGIMLGWGIQNFILDRWYHLDIRYYHGFINHSEFLQNDLIPWRGTASNTAAPIISEYRNSTITITLGVGLELSETFFLR